MKKLEILDVDISEGVTVATVKSTKNVISWIIRPGSFMAYGTEPVRYDASLVICGVMEGGELVKFNGKHYKAVRVSLGMAGTTIINLQEDKDPNG